MVKYSCANDSRSGESGTSISHAKRLGKLYSKTPPAECSELEEAVQIRLCKIPRSLSWYILMHVIHWIVIQTYIDLIMFILTRIYRVASLLSNVFEKTSYITMYSNTTSDLFTG